MSRGESMMSELIKGMHDLAIDLGNHNDFADRLLLKNNSITEKLVVMKEVCFVLLYIFLLYNIFFSIIKL